MQMKAKDESKKIKSATKKNRQSVPPRVKSYHLPDSMVGVSHATYLIYKDHIVQIK